MINTGSVRFVENQDATLFAYGSNDGGSTPPGLSLAASTATGLFAFTQSATLTNVAPIDGSGAASHQITAVRVYDKSIRMTPRSLVPTQLLSLARHRVNLSARAVGLHSAAECRPDHGSKPGQCPGVARELSATVPLQIWYPSG